MVLLRQPHTVTEIGEELGIGKWCVYGYLETAKDRFPLMSRKRVIEGKGMNPLEYWIDYLGWNSYAKRLPEVRTANAVLLHIVQHGFNGEIDG